MQIAIEGPQLSTTDFNEIRDILKENNCHILLYLCLMFDASICSIDDMLLDMLKVQVEYKRGAPGQKRAHERSSAQNGSTWR